jgi:hypothetical protein
METGVKVALNRVIRLYVVGTVIVWISIFAGSAVILSGSNHFGQMLPILLGGVLWSFVVVPGMLYGLLRGQSDWQ